MDAPRSPKPRPYWHVDGKWLSGILLLVLLNITFITYLGSRITDSKTGVDLLTLALASSFSAESGGLDDSGDIEIMRQEVNDAPNGEWRPIPGLNIVVRIADLEGKTPRELRLWFFRQWAQPLYDNGIEGLQDLATDPELKASMEGGLGPMAFFSAATHQKITVALVVSALVSLLFMGLLVLFSYRFGKLGSPGCVIFLAALPGLALAAGLRGWLENAGQNPSPEPGLLDRYTLLAADVLPDVAKQALGLFLPLVLMGLGLMVIALVLTLFLRPRKA